MDSYAERREPFQERLSLAAERIGEIADGGEHVRFADYFRFCADFVRKMLTLADQIADGWLMRATLEELEAHNRQLYADVTGEAYAVSYANPVYAASVMGEDFGPLFAALYTELRQMIVFAYEGRVEELTAEAELFLQIYCSFADHEGGAREQAPVAIKEIRDILYWFQSDYSDLFMEHRVKKIVDPEDNFAVRICMDSDLTDLRYLYYYGEYITDDERLTALHLNALPEKTIRKMARAMSEGYRIGFEKAGIDLSKKRTVDVRYHIGFERMIREAIHEFAAMGLQPTMHRGGFEGACPNRQYVYDHREDLSLYLDKKFVQRRLEAMKAAFERRTKEAAGHAGPAVQEVFGEVPFSPVKTEEAFSLTAKQHRLSVEMQNGMSQLMNTYIIGEERSFTIIAFPLPQIGAQYPQIFDAIVRINTLDYKQYERIQQAVIDALDEGECVHIAGRNGNSTDLYVKLHPLAHPNSQTKFENCVSDVNIPVGEVFTSPVLEGTSGELFVSRVYLNGLLYTDLRVVFEDGMVREYSCSNFQDPEKGRAYILENILKYHETLPMGEFAIGTNTTAYMAARKYGIAERLPILIAEKMGPHFAVGDTCYSWSEDQKTYNPDGKEIVAKDNTCSIRRLEDVSKAYFNTHTDITIPYEELGGIWVLTKDGRKIPIIENGRFVLPGTEELNQPFDEEEILAVNI